MKTKRKISRFQLNLKHLVCVKLSYGNQWKGLRSRQLVSCGEARPIRLQCCLESPSTSCRNQTPASLEARKCSHTDVHLDTYTKHFFYQNEPHHITYCLLEGYVSFLVLEQNEKHLICLNCEWKEKSL